MFLSQQPLLRSFSGPFVKIVLFLPKHSAVASIVLNVLNLTRELFYARKTKTTSPKFFGPSFNYSVQITTSPAQLIWNRFGMELCSNYHALHTDLSNQLGRVDPETYAKIESVTASRLAELRSSLEETYAKINKALPEKEHDVQYAPPLSVDVTCYSPLSKQLMDCVKLYDSLVKAMDVLFLMNMATALDRTKAQFMWFAGFRRISSEMRRIMGESYNRLKTFQQEREKREREEEARRVAKAARQESLSKIAESNSTEFSLESVKEISADEISGTDEIVTSSPTLSEAPGTN